MDAAETLRRVRRGAGLSQRELQRMTGIAQPTIARIEAGLAIPRLDTFERLLEACGETLLSVRSSTSEIDKAAIREQLQAIPQSARIELLLDEATELRAASTRRPAGKAQPKGRPKARAKR